MCDTSGYLPPDDDAVYRGRQSILNQIDDPEPCRYIVSVDIDTGIETPCGEDEYRPGSGLCLAHDPDERP